MKRLRRAASERGQRETREHVVVGGATRGAEGETASVLACCNLETPLGG